jgi:hypothetical protein
MRTVAISEASTVVAEVLQMSGYAPADVCLTLRKMPKQ